VDLGLGLFAALMTYAINLDFGNAFPDLSGRIRLGIAVAVVVLFFAGVLVHELSHSLVAKAKGIPVNRIRLFLFGGVSELESDPATPRDEFQISIAGPIASLAVAAVFGVVWFLVPWEPAIRAARVLTLASAAVGVFNLVPGYPLDGGRILHAVIWGRTGDSQKATAIAVTSGRVVAWALIGVGFFILTANGDLSGLWYLFVGWFLLQLATAAKRRADVIHGLEGLSVAEVMAPVRYAIPGEMTLADYRELYIYGERYPTQPVVVDGRVRGLLGAGQLRDVPDDLWSSTTVAEKMSPIGPDDVVTDCVPVVDVLDKVNEPGKRLVVTAGGRVAGILSVTDVFDKAASRKSLGTRD
ncbi:MAG: site-2 protease family protein, partial [Acidimicrobiia bacterium]|nr:site-2 protease family protein [Acidimicrobiia bacterium]